MTIDYTISRLVVLNDLHFVVQQSDNWSDGPVTALVRRKSSA